MSRIDEQNQIKAAVAKFPAEFGLRAFPGDRFRLDSKSSYFSAGRLVLYTMVWRECPFSGISDSRWLSFSSCSERELNSEIVILADYPMPTEVK